MMKLSLPTLPSMRWNVFGESGSGKTTREVLVYLNTEYDLTYDDMKYLLGLKSKDSIRKYIYGMNQISVKRVVGLLIKLADIYDARAEHLRKLAKGIRSDTPEMQ